MTGYLRLLILLCPFALSIHTVFGQPLSDTAAAHLAALNTIQVYHDFMGEESRLNNGIEHIGYLPMTGHPYYLAETAQTGTVTYENIVYGNIPLWYDIVRDELVTSSPNGELISLAPEKVKEFYLPGHHFIKTSTGYYDLLAAGKMNLEAKRIKRVLESIDANQVVRKIEYADHYFVERDGISYSIGNLRSLLALMKDKKKAVNQDLRSKKIRYRKDHERALVEAVAFYNQSTPQ